MSELESKLGGSVYPFHRGYLVNIAHIIEYGNDNISLSDGESIYLAKEWHNEFVKEYIRYYGRAADITIFKLLKYIVRYILSVLFMVRGFIL